MFRFSSYDMAARLRQSTPFWLPWSHEVATNKKITRIVYYILLDSSMVASANTLDGSPFHWIERIHKNHAARMGNGFTMAVVFVGCEMWLT